MTEQEYIKFVQPYRDAQENLMTRLETLNRDFRRKYQNYPIHNIQGRIKKRESINDKLKKHQHTLSAVSAKINLMDIAGIRIICYFVEDIYNVVDMIKKQTDMVVIKECDYIRNPKPNGYRSYHIVLGVPVYHIDVMEYFPVELQFRTMSMDFWASMEHRICYKKNPEDKELLVEELYKYSELLKEIEMNFEKYYEKTHH